MKIFAAFAAFAAMIALAPAMSFTWSVSGALTFNGSNMVTDGLYKPYARNIRAQLVYLGSDGKWAIADGDINPYKNQTVGETYTPDSTGRIEDKTYQENMGTSYSIGGSVSNGATYGLMIVYRDNWGMPWYNYSSNTYTISGLTNDSSELANATFNFNWDIDYSMNDDATPGGGWWYVPVPEPLTAVGGLAGLALLLKRRA